ncbi:O-Mevalon transferase yanI [Psilocybe cubensis]|uniref:O-Mevalon transferase yanI n=1 Tax=Psilocybe cubensis TaxID=181762 RepID=A0ACB8H2J6_PSICU|nr:O-Mevalon transferase yanI [Psilocybe cubensis]KAH9481892.1 O-Mevalon transferase yanI [Psilocybe cubensis]
MYATQRTSKQPFSVPLILLFAACALLACIPGHRNPTKVFLLVTLSAIAFYVISQTNTGDPIIDLGLGSAILIQVANALDSLYLTDPDTLVNFEQPESGGRITQKPLKERIRWAFYLYTNIRGIGWAHEPAFLHPAPSRSTPIRAFVIRRLFYALLCAAVEFISYVLLASNPALNTPGKVAFSAAPFHWRVMGTLAFGGASSSRIFCVSCVVSAVVVGLGFSTPERWPSLFGSPFQAWSVRQFWSMASDAEKGTSKPTSSPSSNSPLQTLSKLLLVPMAFVFSGILHIGGEWMLLGYPGYGTLTFFCLQGLGVSIEVIAEKVWMRVYVGGAKDSQKSKVDKRADPVRNGSARNGKAINGVNGNGNGKEHTNGFKDHPAQGDPAPALWLRVIGFLWTLTVFSYSVPYMIDPLLAFDMFVDPRFDLGMLVRGR